MRNVIQKNTKLTTTTVTLKPPVYQGEDDRQNAIAFEIELDEKGLHGNVVFEYDREFSLIDMTNQKYLFDRRESYTLRKSDVTKCRLMAVVANANGFVNTTDCMVAIVLTDLLLNPRGSEEQVRARMTVRVSYGIMILDALKLCEAFCLENRELYYDIPDFTAGFACISNIMFQKIKNVCTNVLVQETSGLHSADDVRDCVVNMTEDLRLKLNDQLKEYGLRMPNTKFHLFVSDPFGADWESFMENAQTLSQMSRDARVMEQHGAMLDLYNANCERAQQSE